MTAFGGGRSTEQRRTEREIGRRECGKLLKNPVIWGLPVLFVLINVFFLWTEVGTGEGISEMHDVVQKAETRRQSGLAPCISQTDGEEFYREAKEEARELYTHLDMNKIKEQKLQMCQSEASGWFRTFIDNNYTRLQKRVRQIRETGEDSHEFYPGKYYRIHGLLYSKLMRRLLVEMAVLMLLCVLFLMDYERMEKTEDTVFSTKTGRKLICLKVRAGLWMGFFFCALLAAVSLGLFFAVVPFEGLWHVPVSSAMMAEPRDVVFYYPFITFYRLTAGQYFLLTLAVGGLLVFMTGILGAGVQLRVKNSYLSFLLEVVLFFLFFFIGGMTTSGWLAVLVDLNPAIVWYGCGRWFMENSPWMSFPGSECMGAVLSALTAALVYVRGVRKMEPPVIRH